MGDAKAINSKSESLKKWNGESTEFRLWSEKIMDHLAKVHPEWKPSLKWISKTNESLSFTRLATEHMGPHQEHAIDLAVKLEQLLCDWMPENHYRRRVQLCGGPAEKQNGFMMWRRLFHDHIGEGETQDYAGAGCLREYPHCEKMSQLLTHIDGWYHLYDQFGSELEGAKTHTRGMFLDILPPDFKEEIRKKKKLATAGHRELAAWCRERCILQRKEILSEQTKKHFAFKTSKINKVGRSSPTQETEGVSLPDSG